MFMLSASDYQATLEYLPALDTWNTRGVFGPEHYYFHPNVLHAAYLRKYYGEDVVSLKNVVAALEAKVGHQVYTDAEKDVLAETMKNVTTQYSIIVPDTGKELPASEMVKAYLYGVYLHTHDRPDEAHFGDFSVEERRLFPAGLVGWLEQASHRVIEVATAVDYYALKHGWDEEYKTRYDDRVLFAEAIGLGVLFNYTDTLAFAKSIGVSKKDMEKLGELARATHEEAKRPVLSNSIGRAKYPPSSNIDYSERDAAWANPSPIPTAPVPRPPQSVRAPTPSPTGTTQEPSGA